MKKYGPRPNTVVVKILDMKRDWMTAVPDKYERELALRKVGSSWAKFAAYGSASNVVNSCVNMGIENYYKFIEASGFDSDKYVDKSADAADYIKPYRSDSKKKTVPVEDVPVESELSVVSEPEAASVPDTDTPKLSLDVVSTDTPEVVEVKPVRRRRTRTKQKNTKASLVKLNKVSSADILSDMSTKMVSFVSHLKLYMCALGVSSDDVIAATGLTYFRDIQKKNAQLALFDYIAISKYFIQCYLTSRDSDVRDTFKQIAEMFNDIYVTTLYFNDCVK